MPTKSADSEFPKTFLLKTKAGQPLHFRTLSSTPTKQALAMAIETVLNADADFKPKLPVQSQIDVIIETVTFESEKAGKLSVMVRISGHEADVPKTVNRDDFLAGHVIDVVLDPEDESVGPFEVQFLGGHSRFHYNKAKSELVVEETKGKVHFDSPLGTEGDETIEFSAIGTLIKESASESTKEPSKTSAKPKL